MCRLYYGAPLLVSRQLPGMLKGFRKLIAIRTRRMAKV